MDEKVTSDGGSDPHDQEMKIDEKCGKNELGSIIDRRSSTENGRGMMKSSIP